MKFIFVLGMFFSITSNASVEVNLLVSKMVRHCDPAAESCKDTLEMDIPVQITLKKHKELPSIYTGIWMMTERMGAFVFEYKVKVSRIEVQGEYYWNISLRTNPEGIGHHGLAGLRTKDIGRFDGLRLIPPRINKDGSEYVLFLEVGPSLRD